MSATRLQRLLMAFRAGEVDFVQAWSKEVWPKPNFEAGEPLVHGIGITNQKSRLT